MKEKNNHPISGGKAVVECLKARNIKYVFGLIGSATMELFDALYDEKSIKFIDVRDERTGTHMADAFARASGSHGVIIAGQNGPGATNLVTGVAQAKAAFSPLLSIAGAISTEHQGKDAFQEIDQQKLFEPITKKTFSIKDTKSIAEDLNKALNLTTHDKWGPVHVNIPRDVLAGVESFDSFKIESKIEHKKINENDLEKISLLIEQSSKPVIICGAGIKNSKTQNEVILLSKKLNIPIVSSAGHGDVIPFNCELYGGQMGPRGNKVASSLVKNADLIQENREASDSILIKRPKYLTLKGRTVYGGGGIIPDYYIPITNELSETTINIVTHPDRIIFNFASLLNPILWNKNLAFILLEYAPAIIRRICRTSNPYFILFSYLLITLFSSNLFSSL